MKLVKLIGREMEVQLCTNPPEFAFAIDEFKLQYAAILPCFLRFHVQISLITLQDDESSKRNGCCLKKILRENL
jgi:hypothetical protein